LRSLDGVMEKSSFFTDWVFFEQQNVGIIGYGSFWRDSIAGIGCIHVGRAQLVNNRRSIVKHFITTDNHLVMKLVPKKVDPRCSDRVKGYGYEVDIVFSLSWKLLRRGK
jgi:hypothetical protein